MVAGKEGREVAIARESSESNNRKTTKAVYVDLYHMKCVVVVWGGEL
jgi:hypothetical protein